MNQKTPPAFRMYLNASQHAGTGGQTRKNERLKVIYSADTFLASPWEVARSLSAASMRRAACERVELLANMRDVCREYRALAMEAVAMMEDDAMDVSTVARER